MTRDDRMMAAAMGSWQSLAPFAGLDPDAFTPEVLWRRDKATHARIVMRMVGAGVADVIYKRIFAPQDRGRWAAELAGHRRAVRALRHDPEHVPPAILAEDPDNLATIQDQVRGQTLQEHLLLNFDRPTQRADALRRAGRLLRAYHGATADGNKPFNPERMLDYVRALGWRALAGDVDLADPDLFAVLAEGLDDLAALADGQSVQVAAEHGDLHTNNILISPKRATLVDFGREKTAPVGYDLSRLIANLSSRFSADMPLDPCCGLPQADLAAVSEGYGQSLSDDPALTFLCRCRLLQFWAGLPARAAKRSAFQQQRLVQIQRAALWLAAA